MLYVDLLHVSREGWISKQLRKSHTSKSSHKIYELDIFIIGPIVQIT